VGESIALQLAAEGASAVSVVGRNETRGNGVVSKLRDLGCEGLFIKASMDSVPEVQAVVPKHEEKFGVAHGLVNSAGDTGRGWLKDQSVESWDRLFAVNARAPFILTQAATNSMIRSSIQGSVVNIITITSHGGQPYLCGYAASKGALSTFTKNAAHQLRKDRIKCNGINIGWTASAAEHKLQVEETGDEKWLEKAGEKVRRGGGGARRIFNFNLFFLFFIHTPSSPPTFSPIGTVWSLGPTW
jgi:NAD(P)-dependent dehydrogenase (short-subunit alcohol dehydrogenase family)